MEKFVEKPFIDKSISLSVFMLIASLLIALITSFVGLFVGSNIFIDSILGTTLITFIIFSIYGTIVASFSKRKEYSRNLINYFKDNLKGTYTLKELYSLYGEFDELVLVKNMYSLDYVSEFKKIKEEILIRIELLHKLKEYGFKEEDL